MFYFLECTLLALIVRTYLSLNIQNQMWKPCQEKSACKSGQRILSAYTVVPMPMKTDTIYVHISDCDRRHLSCYGVEAQKVMSGSTKGIGWRGLGEGDTQNTWNRIWYSQCQVERLVKKKWKVALDIDKMNCKILRQRQEQNLPPPPWNTPPPLHFLKS